MTKHSVRLGNTWPFPRLPDAPFGVSPRVTRRANSWQGYTELAAPRLAIARPAVRLCFAGPAPSHHCLPRDNTGQCSAGHVRRTAGRTTCPTWARFRSAYHGAAADYSSPREARLRIAHDVAWPAPAHRIGTTPTTIRAMPRHIKITDDSQLSSPYHLYSLPTTSRGTAGPVVATDLASPSLPLQGVPDDRTFRRNAVQGSRPHLASQPPPARGFANDISFPRAVSASRFQRLRAAIPPWSARREACPTTMHLTNRVPSNSPNADLGSACDYSCRCGSWRYGPPRFQRQQHIEATRAYSYRLAAGDSLAPVGISSRHSRSADQTAQASSTLATAPQATYPGAESLVPTHRANRHCESRRDRPWRVVTVPAYASDGSVPDAAVLNAEGRASSRQATTRKEQP
jgi:hypothetical protein